MTRLVHLYAILYVPSTGTGEDNGNAHHPQCFHRKASERGVLSVGEEQCLCESSSRDKGENYHSAITLVHGADQQAICILQFLIPTAQICNLRHNLNQQLNLVINLVQIFLDLDLSDRWHAFSSVSPKSSMNVWMQLYHTVAHNIFETINYLHQQVS